MKHYSAALLGLALAATAASGMLALDVTPAAADAILSPDEATCQSRVSAIQANFERRYVKCIIKCAKRVGTPLAPQQCTRAGACALGIGDLTCRCFMRAETLTIESQTSRCPDCPECYVNQGGDQNPECGSDATARVNTIGAWVESLLLNGSTPVYCDDSASVDGHDVAEAKCEKTVAKTLGALFKTKENCLADCRAAERGGVTPPGSCDPPLISNPTASQEAKNCIFRAEDRARYRISHRCEPDGGDRPECYGTQDAAAWVADVESFVDGQDASFWCGF